MDSIVFAKVASNVHVAFNVSLAKLYCISFLYSREFGPYDDVCSAFLTPTSALSQ